MIGFIALVADKYALCTLVLLGYVKHLELGRRLWYFINVSGDGKLRLANLTFTAHLLFLGVSQSCLVLSGVVVGELDSIEVIILILDIKQVTGPLSIVQFMEFRRRRSCDVKLLEQRLVVDVDDLHLVRIA